MYLWCEGWFLEVEDTPTLDPALLRPPPPPRCCPHCYQPPSSPSAPRSTPPLSVATDEQPFAKNTQFYTNFHIFFKFFENFFNHLLSSFTLRCQGTTSRVL